MTSPIPASSSEKDDYRRALQKIETLHGNMAVLSRLGTKLQDINTGIDDISKLLQTDGALCANVIRISNSIRYGVGTRVLTLTEALIKVGFRQILSLVGAALSKQVFMRDLSAYGMTANDYWAYSYFSALFVEAQARRCDCNSDEAYLVGLLHAIGRVAINELLLKTKIDVYWDRSIPCEEWEHILIGFQYHDAGASLLKSWNFNPAVYQRVGNQRSPKIIAQDPILQALDYARACAEINYFRLEGPDWIMPPNDHPFLKNTCIDPADMPGEIQRTKQACLQIKHAIEA